MAQAEELKFMHRHDIEEYDHSVAANFNQEQLLCAVRTKLKQEDAVLVAHYYTDPNIQALAEETGGLVADSLEMARFGKNHSASTLLVAGVRFMGETAKILSPEKRVLMPTLKATCSLDIGCPAEEFRQFCAQHSEKIVVVYANTSAAVKALADWVVTSSCAVEIVEHIMDQGQEIIWAPDRYLGRYIQSKTQADMLLWDSACVVHEAFKAQGLKSMMALYPEAAVLVHPESPEDVVALADVVGSTSQLIKAAVGLPNKMFIVSTEVGIFYKMQQLAGPEKTLICAPTGGNGATCKSCARCPWMQMNTLELIYNALALQKEEVIVSENLRKKALLPLNRMLNFTNSQRY